MADPNSEADTPEEPEDTEEDGEAFEVERLLARADGAAALRRLADGVAHGTVVVGDAVTVRVPEQFELEIEFEEEGGEAELDVELEWPIVNGESVGAEQESDSRADDDGDGEEDVTVQADAGRPIDEVIGVGNAASNARFELYRDRAGEWRWRLVHANGNIIADSGEGYDRKATARNGLESVMRNAPGATIVEVE